MLVTTNKRAAQEGCLLQNSRALGTVRQVQVVLSAIQKLSY
jgi:hypothetical protein